MVEAAVIFPVIILTAMALIYILIYFYQQAEVRAQMHIALREESGRVSQTVTYLTKVKRVYPIYKRGKFVSYEGNMPFLKQGILNGMGKQLQADKYVDDEKNFVRYVDLIKQKEPHNEE